MRFSLRRKPHRADLSSAARQEHRGHPDLLLNSVVLIQCYAVFLTAAPAGKGVSLGIRIIAVSVPPANAPAAQSAHRRRPHPAARVRWPPALLCRSPRYSLFSNLSMRASHFSMRASWRISVVSIMGNRPCWPSSPSSAAKHLQFVSVFTPLLQALLHLALDLRELFQNLGLDGERIGGLRPRAPSETHRPRKTHRSCHGDDVSATRAWP